MLLAGRPLVVSDTFHLSMLTTSEFFDPLELERRIKRNEFDLIVMRSDVRAARWWKRQLLLPETVRLAIKDTYVPAGRVGMFWLYKPEGLAGSPAVSARAGRRASPSPPPQAPPAPRTARPGGSARPAALPRRSGRPPARSRGRPRGRSPGGGRP